LINIHQLLITIALRDITGTGGGNRREGETVAKELAHLKVPHGDTEIKRRLTILIDTLPYFAAVGDEDLYDVNLVLSDGVKNRLLAFVILGISVGAILKEQAHDTCVASGASLMQRSGAFDVSLVRIRSELEKHPDHVNVLVVNGHVKGRTSIKIGDVWGGMSTVEKSRYDAAVAVHDCRKRSNTSADSLAENPKMAKRNIIEQNRFCAVAAGNTHQQSG
jgi:hypothetical protein